MEREISGAFDDWNDALRTGDPDRVVSCYAADAILVPTLSSRIRHTHNEIRDYFVHFLSKRPAGHMVEQNIRVYGIFAINSGLYSFTVTENGEQREIAARFTFVYCKHDSNWWIKEHHSSLLPMENRASAALQETDPD